MKRFALGMACLGLLSCGRSPKESEQPISVATLYEVDLREPLPEQGSSFLGEQKPGVLDGVRKLSKLLEEPLTRGLFVRLGPLAGRFGDLADWAALFDAYRAQKRPVHCHFDVIDNLGFALANHCDRVSMTPSGTLDLVGIAAQVVHGKALLDKLGVQAELLQVGRYKGAAEPFTRDDMSPELKQSMDGLLDDLDATLRAHLTHAGTRTPEAVKAAIDGGPYTAEGARSQGLVDTLTYDDEARALAKKTAAAASVRPLFPEKNEEEFSLRELLSALAGDDEDASSTEARIAVVFLTGEIVDGDSAGVGRSGSDPFVKALRRMGDDNRVRALVLRIDSPGGSALASDRMWHAVRRVAARKPVIVSVGEMAASGGYYVASAGAHILASEGSILGSIGVVGGKIIGAELAEKVGVHVDTLKRAEHATWLSALSPFSPEERTRLEKMLVTTYDLFLNRVSLGRKRSVEQLTPAAEGRVMGGERAKQFGLVDEIGGLSRALELARERGKLTKSAKVVEWPTSNAFSAVSALIGAHAPRVLLGDDLSKLGEQVRDVSNDSFLPALSAASAPVLTTLPFSLRVR